MRFTELHECGHCGRDFEREAACQFGSWRQGDPERFCSLRCAWCSDRLNAAEYDRCNAAYREETLSDLTGDIS